MDVLPRIVMPHVLCAHTTAYKCYIYVHCITTPTTVVPSDRLWKTVAETTFPFTANVCYVQKEEGQG